MQPASPVVKGLEAFEVVFGENQPEYTPLPALVGKRPFVNVISRWALSDDERRLISEGADVYIVQTTFGDFFQPLQAGVAGYMQDPGEFVAQWNVGEVLPKKNVDAVLDSLNDKP